MGERHYHFCEGKWYCVNQQFVETLRNYLDPHFADTMLPANTFSNEAAYNQAVSDLQSKTLLFDKVNFTRKGQTPIELCDLCQLGPDNSVSLIHVKIGVHSSRLSHLFAQGYVSTKELLSDSAAISHFEKKITASKLDNVDKKIIVESIADRKFRVIFAIITPKKPTLKSGALPFFSRINLRRAIESLKLLGIESSIHIVADNYAQDKT